jgi:hypothetical protein
LHHDGDHHRLDAIEDALHLRQRAVSHVRPRRSDHDQHRGRDEADSGDSKPERTGAAAPDVNRHFGRTRSRHQVRCAEHVEEFVARDPAAAAHEFLLHHRDVCGRAAERGEAEPQERRCDFAQHPRARRFESRLGGHARDANTERWCIARGLVAEAGSTRWASTEA